MNLLSRYLIGEQLRVMLLTLSALCGITVAVRALEKTRHFMGAPDGMLLLTQYAAFSLPKVVLDVVPFALLLATVLSVGAMSARSEITAMRAAGMGLIRIAAPLLWTGLAVSLLCVYLAWGPVPKANGVTGRALAAADTGRTGTAVAGGRERIWFREGAGTFFGIRLADGKSESMWEVRILELDGTGGVARLTTAKRMEWTQAGWELQDGQVAESGEAGLTLTPFERRPAPLKQPPATLGEVTVRIVSALSYRELARHVRRLSAEGHDTTRMEVELAGRMAFPFASLVMVLMAVPYGITQPRSRSLARRIAVALLIALGFWVLYALSTALGRAGMLPPLVACWLPIAVFAAFGTYRLSAVSQ